MATETVSIPEPPGLPLIGNAPVPFFGTKLQVSSLADTYGPIFRLRFGGRSVVFVTNHELVNEVCDERRFHKSIQSTLKQVREGVHDGLFTSFEGEEAWGKAHRILIPAFGPLPIRGMFDEMYDISSQLAMKFARQGSTATVNPTEDFTKLALDTLALCSMEYRFNSFYKEEMHPFVQAMGDFLTECGERNQRPGVLPEWAYRKRNEKFYADIKIMRDTADQVVKARRKNPSNRNDLLGAMLEGVDKTTGEKLSDENITNQLITFLIAGHETTSGTLSFAFYHLLKNPEEYKKVQQEVDHVVGSGPVRVEHLSKLPYIAAVLRETLRVNSPINALALQPYEDTLLGGKYPVGKGEPVTCLFAKSHLDPAVYGPDATEFNPERMLEDAHAQRLRDFPNCWKPFGKGKRGCIGRPFAWQEMVLCMAVLFQNFEFEMVNPSYELIIQRTLTLKPTEFEMRAKLRGGLTATELEKKLAGKEDEKHERKEHSPSNSTDVSANGKGKPMAIYYGSNSGTCEAMAQQLAADAPLHGFRASTLSPLDEATNKLPTDRPIIIVTASYEGKPPSNAETFIPWLEKLKANEAHAVNYAVFGCGHRDWIDTFHQIPKLIDTKLQDSGASRLASLSCTDAADRDMFSDFERWEDEMLWPALEKTYNIATEKASNTGGISVEFKSSREDILRQKAEEATVVGERALTSPDALATKKHIDIQLPPGMSYKVGDYLNILPHNHAESVGRVIRRFELSNDTALRISADRPTPLPTGRDLWIREVLGSYVEINQPASQKKILTLADNASNEDEASSLRSLADEKTQESTHRASVIDLLERYPSVNLSFTNYLSMLPAMRTRQYSISSSPLSDPTKASLTYSLLDAPSTTNKGRHHGVATSYLSPLRPGDRLPVSVRPSTSTFYLPDPSTPLIMIAAGSGLAPFRGFIQERSMLASKGSTPSAPALLFFGCRGKEDDIYADELDEFEEQGVVSVRRAYSRAEEGAGHVQDRILGEKTEMCKMWQKGARVYVCGSRKMAKAAEDACVRILRENVGEEERIGLDWWTSRFSADVFD